MVHDVRQSTIELNDDLDKISNWAYQWKMPFNSVKSKQAQEVIFSRITQKVIDPTAIFNNMPIVCSSCQKHLCIYLDEKLNFSNHIKEKLSKTNKSIGILRKLYNVLPRNSLITIYKSFLRPHLDYGAIIFDQPENESFCRKIESVQYNAAPAITGAIQGTSREKVCKELGLETLRSRRWLKKLCCFCKIKNNRTSSYLAELILSKSHLYNTRNTRNITFSFRTDAFKYSFLPWTINECNKRNFNIRTSSFNIFRANLIKIIRPIPNSVFGIFNPLGLKLITRLWLGLSHLNEDRFNHNFNDCINRLCTCSLDMSQQFTIF